MKKIVKQSAAIIVASIALTSVAHAATPGFYAGLGLGGSKLQTEDKFLVPGSSQSRELGGLGGRAFAGYNFNPYFGLEGGYATYAHSEYKGSVPGLYNASLEYTESNVNIVAKGYLPLGESHFNLYALGGAAEVFEKTEVKANVPAAGINGKKSYENKALRPTYGAGISYDVNQHVTTNLEYSRVQGRGNTAPSAKDTKAIPDADLLTLNVSYNFG